MPLYSWKSEALAGYLEGSIIVLASNVSAARKKVIKEVRRRNQNAQPDTLEKRLAAFEKDIASEPDTIDVHFIYGSD